MEKDFDLADDKECKTKKKKKQHSTTKFYYFDLQIDALSSMKDSNVYLVKLTQLQERK